MPLLVFQPTVASLSSGGVGGSADEYSPCQTDSGRGGADVVDRRSGESSVWVLAAQSLASALALALLPIDDVVALLAAAGSRDRKRETDDGLLGTEPCEARRLRYFLFPGNACCCSCWKVGEVEFSDDERAGDEVTGDAASSRASEDR